MNDRDLERIKNHERRADRDEEKERRTDDRGCDEAERDGDRERDRAERNEHRRRDVRAQWTAAQLVERVRGNADGEPERHERAGDDPRIG